MDIGDAITKLINSAKRVDDWFGETIRVSSVNELKEYILKANEDRTLIFPIRSGRTIDIDLIDRKPIDISQIEPEIDIRPDRLTVKVGSTMMVEDLNIALNSVKMKIDAVNGFERISIGGLVAMGLSAPHRLPGRLNLALLGLDVIDNKGNEFFTGRRTLKGVAGYHLNSMYIASFGNYGYLKNLIFRMNPQEEVSEILCIKLKSLDDYMRVCRTLNTLSSYKGSVFINNLLSAIASNVESHTAILRFYGSSYAVCRAKDTLMSEMLNIEGLPIRLNTLTDPNINYIKEGGFILCAKLSSENISNIKKIEEIPYIIRSDGFIELLLRGEDFDCFKYIRDIKPHIIYYKDRNRLLVNIEDSIKSVNL